MSELRVLEAELPQIYAVKNHDYDKLVPYAGWKWRKRFGWTYHELYSFQAQLDPLFDRTVDWLRHKGWV